MQQKFKYKLFFNGYFLMVFLAIGICGILFIFTQFWSIYNVVLSTNVSRPRRMQFATEYFVDQEKYFSLILLHISTALFIGAIGMVATGTMLIAYFKFICGLFKISR